MLVTSRIRLNRREEWLQSLVGLNSPPLPELAEPADKAPAELEACDATRLFLQCARQLRSDFQPTPQDALHIVHICQRLEGMPLAIELTAAWTSALPLSVLVVEVEGSLGLLKNALDDAPPGQRSMSATFEHSWRLAFAREQSILRQCSVFYPEAKRKLAAAIALREQTGEVRFRAHNLTLLARVLTVTGAYQAAEVFRGGNRRRCRAGHCPLESGGCRTAWGKLGGACHRRSCQGRTPLSRNVDGARLCGLENPGCES